MALQRIFRHLAGKKLGLVAGAGLLVLACGAVPAGPGATPSPSPTHGLGFDVVATEKDRSVTLRVGQTLEVALHAAPNMNPWMHPVSTNTAVLKPIVDPAATAARGVSLAAFQAIAPGHVQVTSYAGPTCPSGAMCPMYVVAYTLDVTVTG